MSDGRERGMSMSKTERHELARVVRLRAKVAKDGVGQLEAEQLAGVEDQLSATYRFDQDVWAEITRGAEGAVKVADDQIARICRDLGVPERFRPSLHLQWYQRGENALSERRAELRKVAQARIAGAGKKAKQTIDAKAAGLLTDLIAGGLESEEARAFLDSIPTAAALMPPVEIAELDGSRALTEGATDPLELAEL